MKKPLRVEQHPTTKTRHIVDAGGDLVSLQEMVDAINNASVPEEKPTFEDGIAMAAKHIEAQHAVWDHTEVPIAHIIQTLANNIRALKPEFMNKGEASK